MQQPCLDRAVHSFVALSAHPVGRLKSVASSLSLCWTDDLVVWPREGGAQLHQRRLDAQAFAHRACTYSWSLTVAETVCLHIWQVIEQLDLETVAHTLIGDAWMRGLSVGEL